MELRFQIWRGEPFGALQNEAAVRGHFGLSPHDKAYMVFVNGKLTIFQYCVPFVAGIHKLTDSNIQAVMVDHERRLRERYGLDG